MNIDNDLLIRAVDGDVEAFGDICVHLLPELTVQQRKRCQRFGIPSDQAEDIVQESLLRAISQFRRHRKVKFPDHYIIKILLNVTRDRLKKRRAERIQVLPADIAAKPREILTDLTIREAFSRLEEQEQEILQLVL